jgi:formate/nitrite transporter FocA (FNT family)
MKRTARPAANQVRAVVPSLVLNGVVPLLVYLLSRPYLSSDASALAIAMAVPAACTIGIFGWRRRLDAIGVIAVVAFGVALIVVLLSGGDSFVLKLQEAVVTGPVGLIFLVSVAARRPVLLTAARLLNRRDPQQGDHQTEHRRRHASTVLTAIMGGTLVVHAFALTLLALVLTTAQVLALSRLVGLSILALGLIVLLSYRGRLQSAARTATAEGRHSPSATPMKETNGSRGGVTAADTR